MSDERDEDYRRMAVLVYGVAGVAIWLLVIGWILA